MGARVKTKYIEIIRFTADSGDLEFVTISFLIAAKTRPNVGC